MLFAAFDSISLSSLGLLVAIFLAICALAGHAKAEGMSRTREQFFAWFIPSLLAFTLAIVSAWLFNQVDFGSPDALLEIGAHYAPRSNANEPWRFLTSFFIHDELVLALVNGVALLWIGWHLSREIGTINFVIALFTCQIAASFMASEIDLQTLYFGAGGALVGVSALTLTLQRWRFLKSRDAVALVVILLHTAVTTLAALEGAIVDIEAISSSACTGAALGILTLIFRRACERKPVQAVKKAHAFGCAVLFTVLALVSQHLLVPEDVIGALQSARSKRAELTERLKELENSRATGALSAGEFAEKISSDVLEPIDAVSDEIETLVQSRKTHARWLEADRREGAVKALGLEIISTVYRAKEQLLSAREKIVAGDDSAELETFWRETLPLLSRQVNALHEMSARSKAQKMLVTARSAAIRDLTDLETSATDLEIMKGEFFLSNLRAFSLGLKTHVEEDDRKPASDPDWNQISTDIVSHKQRLELIASRIRSPSDRLQALVGHLDKAHAAVVHDLAPLDPPLEAPSK